MAVFQWNYPGAMIQHEKRCQLDVRGPIFATAAAIWPQDCLIELAVVVTAANELITRLLDYIHCWH